MVAEKMQDRRSAYPGHGVDLAESLEGVRAYLDHCHAESLALFDLTEEQLAAASTSRKS